MPEIEDLGIAFIHSIFAEMGCFFRPQDKHDFGIDAQVEIDDGHGKGTGRTIALQIKSGKRYINYNKEGDLVFYDTDKDGRHIKYWAENTLPVALIIYSPEQKTAWWCDVKAYVSRHPTILLQPPYKIVISHEQILSIDSKEEFAELAFAPSSKLSLDEKYYDLLSEDDISTDAAKRYRAAILVREANYDVARLAIYQATKYLKTTVEHSSAIQEAHWGNQPPHLIWLFVYKTLEDRVHDNWIARALWRDTSSETTKLITLDRVNDHVEDIEIDFVDRTQQQYLQEYLSRKVITKTQFINRVESCVPQIDTLIGQAAKLIEEISDGQIDETVFTNEMGKLEQAYSQLELLYRHSTIVPIDCHDAERQFVTTIGSGVNIFIPLSRGGLETWPDFETRLYLAKSSLVQFRDNRQMLEYEMRKLKH